MSFHNENLHLTLRSELCTIKKRKHEIYRLNFIWAFKMYTNYQSITVDTFAKYQKLCKQFDTNKTRIEQISVNGNKTSRIVKNLGLFEQIKVFFELVVASLRSCFYKNNPASQSLLDNAWKALKNHQWVRIVKFKKSSPDTKVKKLANHFQKNDPKVNLNSKNPVKPIYVPAKAVFKDDKDRKAFEAQLKDIIRAEEKPSKDDVKVNRTPSPKNREPFVKNCLLYINDVNKFPLDDQSIYEMINQIVQNPLEMKAFVAGLSENNNHKLLFKLLQREKQNVEGPTAKENRQKRLAALFSALSKTQFDAMIQSGKFANMCELKECLKAITTCFTSEQLEKLASSWKNSELKKNSMLIVEIERTQKCLIEVIKALPPGNYLLGKLVAILPHLSSAGKQVCIDKIVSLLPKSRPGFPYDPMNIDNSKHVVFIEKLEALTLLYAQENDLLIDAINKEISAQKGTTQVTPTKKWEVNTSYLNTEYNTEEISKKTFDQDDFTRIVADLENPLKSNDEIRNTLGLMDELSIKALVRMASPKALSKLWGIESKNVNEGSLKTDRTTRLKWVFAALSDDQLKTATESEEFLKILADSENGNSMAAAEIFTVDQLVLIASNWKTHQHFVKVIVKLETEKCIEFLPKVIPNCSPFLQSSLNRRIELIYKSRTNPTRKSLQKQIQDKCDTISRDNKEIYEAWLLYLAKNPNR